MPLGGALNKLTVHIGAVNTKLNKVLNQSVGSLNKFAGKAQQIGGTLSTSVTAPLALIGGLSVKAFGSFEQAITQSTAISADFAAQQEKLKSTALDVSKSTGRAAKDVAEGYFFLASAGLDASTSLKAIKPVTDFANAGMFDLATAVDLSTDALTALGLQTGEAEQDVMNLKRVTDVLVKGNTIANASVQQFAEALTNDAAAAARVTGKEIEETVAVLAVMADQGKKGAAAGTQFRIALTNLKSKAIENRKAFKDLNVNVFDLSGNMNNMADIVKDMEVSFAGMSDEQEQAALSQLGFGEKTVQTISRLIGFSDKIRDYEAKLKQAGGTTEEVSNNQLNTFQGALKKSKAEITAVAIQLGELLAPAVQTVADFFVGAAKKASELITWFQSLSQTTQKVVAIIGGLVIIAGPALLALAAMAKVAAFAAGGIVVLTKAITFLTAHPLILLATLAAAAGVAILTLGDDAAHASKDLGDVEAAIIDTSTAAGQLQAAHREFDNIRVSVNTLGQELREINAELDKYKDASGIVPLHVLLGRDGKRLLALQERMGQITTELKRLHDVYGTTNREVFDAATKNRLLSEAYTEQANAIREATKIAKIDGDTKKRNSVILAEQTKLRDLAIQLLGVENERTISLIKSVATLESKTEQLRSAEQHRLQEARDGLRTRERQIAVTEDYANALKEIDITSEIFADRQRDIQDAIGATEGALLSFVQNGLKEGVEPALIEADPVFQGLKATLFSLREELLINENAWRQWGVGIKAQLASTQAIVNTFSTISLNAFKQFSAGVGQSLGRAVAFGEDFDSAMDNLWRSIVSNVIAALVDMIIQYGVFALANAVIGKTLAATQVGAQAAITYATGFAQATAALGFPAALIGAPAYAGALTSVLIAGSAAAAGAGSAVALLDVGGVTGPSAEGLAYLHPNEIVMPVDAAIDRFMPAGGNGAVISLLLDGTEIGSALLPGLSESIEVELGVTT